MIKRLVNRFKLLGTCRVELQDQGEFILNLPEGMYFGDYQVNLSTKVGFFKDGIERRIVVKFPKGIPAPSERGDGFIYETSSLYPVGCNLNVVENAVIKRIKDQRTMFGESAYSVEKVLNKPKKG